MHASSLGYQSIYHRSAFMDIRARIDIFPLLAFEESFFLFEWVVGNWFCVNSELILFCLSFQVCHRFCFLLLHSLLWRKLDISPHWKHWKPRCLWKFTLKRYCRHHSPFHRFVFHFPPPPSNSRTFCNYVFHFVNRMIQTAFWRHNFGLGISECTLLVFIG